MCEDDRNEPDDDVGELVEEAGVEVKDSEEDSEQLAEVYVEVDTLEALDEPADQITVTSEL